MIEQLLSPDLVHALGWTLVHTLWQAAVYALLLGLLLILLRKYSAQARYVVAIGLLVAFFVTVGVTFYGLLPEESAPISSNPTTVEMMSDGPRAIPEASPTSSAVTPEISTPGFRERVIRYYNDHLPLIVTLWLMGVLVLQLRLLGQLAFVQRLKNYGTNRFPTEWATKIQELEGALKLSKPVRYLTTHRISSPMVIGWLRPAVLFPAPMLQKLQENQVVAILAHELAHVKRHDFAVNLLQSLFCTVFFYHPAVWWMSARVEEEREHCCDDIAIRATGQPVGYAKTLLELKESELANPRMAMAFTGSGKGFKVRISRLLSGYLGTSTYGEGFTTAVIIAGCIALAVNLSGQREASPLTSDLNGESTILQQPEGPPAPPPPPPPPAQPSGTEGFIRPTPELSPEQSLKVNDMMEDLLAGQLRLDPNDPQGTFELFMHAIYEGELELVQYFLDKGEITDLNQADQFGYTPLMAAASEHHTEVTRLLLKRGAQVNHVSPNGWTALMAAAEEGAVDAVKLLLESGADVNLKGKNTPHTPLTVAAENGHTDIFTLLVTRGADIFSLGDDIHPLLAAAKEGELGTVRQLIDLKTDLNVTDHEGRTAIMYATEDGFAEVVEELIRRGADAGATDSRGRTALHYAAGEGHFEVAKVLLKAGLDPNQLDQEGHAPVVYAVDDGHVDVIRLFVEVGKVDLEALRAGGHDLMEIAAKEGHEHVLEYLLDGKAIAVDDEEAVASFLAAAREGKLNIVRRFVADGMSVDVRNEDGYRALDLAAREGKLTTVEYLLDQMSSDTKLEPAFLLAAREGKYSVVKLLLEQQIDPQATDRDGYTALALAAREGKQEVVELLRPAAWSKEDLNLPLQLAAREGKLATVTYLHREGADLNAADEDGNTSLSLAVREGKYAVAQYLIEQGADVAGSSRGCSPVFLAARERQASLITLLASNKADLESTCSYRDIDYFDNGRANRNTIAQYENATPLVVALTETDMASVSALIRAGANVNARSRKLRFVANRKLDYRDSFNLTEASMRQQFDLDYEADGWTPLMEAVETGNADFVILLLKNGADRSLATDQGLTALQLAKNLKLDTIVRALQ